MAPKRGGGGSGRYSGYSATCPYAFTDPSTIAYFVSSVFLFAALLGVAIVLFVARKKAWPGKKLLGACYVGALAFYLIAYCLHIIGVVLSECSVLYSRDATPIYITSSVLIALGSYLLLVVVLGTLNGMLRSRLGDAAPSFRLISMAVLAVMAVMTVAVLIMFIYVQIKLMNFWTIGDLLPILNVNAKLNAAYSVLYLVSVLIAGALSVVLTRSMRSRKMTGGALLPWVIALTVSMTIWELTNVILSLDGLTSQSLYLPERWPALVALDYIMDLFLILSFVLLIAIAKHPAWSRATTGTAHVYDSLSHQQGYDPEYTHQHPATQGEFYQPRS